jgi:hypothetical protein
MKVERFILLSLFFLLLQGCVGVSYHEKKVKQSVKYDGVSKKIVLQKLGQPDEDIKSSDRSTWVYSLAENKWCGAIVWLFIPIPLILPVCEEVLKVEFKSGFVEKTLRYTMDFSGKACGPGVYFINGMTEKRRVENPWCIGGL